MAHHATPEHRESDAGFTLVELLIVIVILGVLATVTVFAVRGITDQGSDSAVAADVKTLESAEESYMALNGSYGTEADLVTVGLLRAESSLHDITLAGVDYTIVAEGGGAPAPSGVATEGVATTIAGVPARRLGTGGAFIFVGGATAAAEWDQLIGAGYTAFSGDAFYFVNVADITSTAIADALSATAPGKAMIEDDVANFSGADSLVTYLFTHGPISDLSVSQMSAYLIAP